MYEIDWENTVQGLANMTRCYCRVQDFCTELREGFECSVLAVLSSSYNSWWFLLYFFNFGSPFKSQCHSQTFWSLLLVHIPMASSVSLCKQMLISCTLPGIQRVSSFGWRGNGGYNLLDSNTIWITPNGDPTAVSELVLLLLICWFSVKPYNHLFYLFSLERDSKKPPLLPTTPLSPEGLPTPPATLLTVQGTNKFLLFSSRAHPRIVLSVEAQDPVLRKLSGYWNFQHLIVLSSVLAASWVDVPFLSSRGAGALSVIFLIFYLT